MPLQLPTMLFCLIDNHLHQGNELGIDQRRILWKRVVDLNDRALRHVTVGLGGPLMVFHVRMVLILQLLLKSWRFCAWQRTSRI